MSGLRPAIHYLRARVAKGQPATAELLLAVDQALLQRGLPPFAKGKVVRALFVPVLPRTRPKSLPREVRLVDAATVIAAAGHD